MNNYDKINVERYRLGQNSKYLCTLCGQYTSLDDSISHRGWNLVCTRCERKMIVILGGNANFIDKIHKVGAAHEAEAIDTGEIDKEVI